MSEEEELKGIRREVWWLSTFLVKIPLMISAFAAVVWLFSQVDCSTSSQDSFEDQLGPKAKPSPELPKPVPEPMPQGREGREEKPKSGAAPDPDSGPAQ